jgi:hypothetical protein
VAVAAVRGLALAIALAATPAWAASADDRAAVEAELDELRGEVAAEIQLRAYDLLDELVYEWTQHPPFAAPTPVVLASVTVPVGLGTGLEALVENHFATLVLQNPTTRMTLVYCGECTAVLVHSGAKGTVVSRGVDDPAALARFGTASTSRHALFLDFEGEGESLVLRARVTSLEPMLPIVYARTLTSATSASAMLRDPARLTSAAEARREYLEAIEGRGVFTVPVRLAVRSYSKGNTQATILPFIWLEAGVEVGFTQARAWIGSLSLGYSYNPSTHDGWLASARIARLVSGRVRSLTQPDLYLFLGVSAINVRGQDAQMFELNPPPLTNIVAGSKGDRPSATFAAWKVGLELRVKNRIGASFFLESLPMLQSAPALGSYLDVGFTKFQTMGAEVTFCF